LNATVREAIDLTRSRWEHEAQVRGARIELTFEPGALPAVSGRNSELREVVTNLILNAVDAVPRGGRVAIRTWGEPGRAVVSVGDSGPGMSEDVRGRAFEPFFTTKGVRRLGLGLAVAYGLVSGHGGDITLESSEGRGTTVVFWVPATALVETAAPAPAGNGERHGRILVVDDEADVREVLADVLLAQGHSVTLAGGGQEALACLERDLFDLVITDLGMPDVNGWDVARAVKNGRQGLPVLLLTGWSDAVESGVGRVDAVIKKPFDMGKLAAAVNAALRPEG
jgi:CheY-like chemotaxis protein